MGSGPGKVDAGAAFGCSLKFEIEFLQQPSNGGLDLRADEPADQDNHRYTGPYRQGGIQAGISQDTNDRSAGDVVGQIERIGDQPERPPDQAGASGEAVAGSRLPIFLFAAPGNEAAPPPPKPGPAQRADSPEMAGMARQKESGKDSRFLRHTRRGTSRRRRPIRAPSMSLFADMNSQMPEREEAAMVQHPCCARHAEHQDHPIGHVGFKRTR